MSEPFRFELNKVTIGFIIVIGLVSKVIMDLFSILQYYLIGLDIDFGYGVIWNTLILIFIIDMCLIIAIIIIILKWQKWK
jgi:hypothetical protein